MKGILTSVVLAIGLLSPAFAQNGQGQNGQQGQQGQNGGGGISGAPGPLAGAGLPILAGVGIGYGIYWIVRRRRNTSTTARMK
jgi:hypothetical protein